MPKAANPFDYRSLADVLLTIEYTALYNADYQQQVIQSLNPVVRADRPYSLRQQFLDQWYDLHNPDQSGTPMSVCFATTAEDFPPNLQALKIDNVLLYVGRLTEDEEPMTIGLHFSESDGGSVGGEASPVAGLISTRRGNAGSWLAMSGKRPVGDWQLAFADTPEIRRLFKNEQIEDILFVISYSGRTPDWPD